METLKRSSRTRYFHRIGPSRETVRRIRQNPNLLSHRVSLRTTATPAKQAGGPRLRRAPGRMKLKGLHSGICARSFSDRCRMVSLYSGPAYFGSSLGPDLLAASKTHSHALFPISLNIASLLMLAHFIGHNCSWRRRAISLRGATRYSDR